MVMLLSTPPPPRIEHRQLVSWVLRLVAVDVVLLLAWTLVDTPQSVGIVDIVSDGIGEKGNKKTESSCETSPKMIAGECPPGAAACGPCATDNARPKAR